MVATALDDPRGLNRRKGPGKGKINLASGKVGKKGKGKKAPTVVSVDGEPAEGTAAAAGGDKVLDMQSREKKLKRELNKRAKKFMKGDTVNTKNVKDKKTKAQKIDPFSDDVLAFLKTADPAVKAAAGRFHLLDSNEKDRQTRFMLLWRNSRAPLRPRLDGRA